MTLISYIKGPLAQIDEDTVVVEAGGVGYGIQVPTTVLSQLPKMGQEVVLYTCFQVREDAMSLYGFLNRQDLEVFRQLIGVNGIGPKGALAILSVLKPDQLRLAIATGDAKAISKAPGIGARTAQRVILELKDRISTEDLLPRGLVGEELADPSICGAAKDAADALVALGYSGAQALGAVRKVELTEDMTVEDVLKASLKHLAFL